MAESQNLHQRFKDLAVRLFEAHGLTVIHSPDSEADFIAISKQHDQHAVVEVKLYHSQSAPESLLRNASIRVAHAKRQLSATQALLVTTARVPHPFQAECKRELGVVVYDLGTLFVLTAGLPDLRQELEDLLREAIVFRSTPLVQPEAPVAQPDLTFSLLVQPNARVPPSPTHGSDLCQRLRVIPSGLKDASRFAETCVESIKYVFKDDFVGWKSELSTDSDLFRFDLIGRISSQDEFWNSLIQDFRTRYVIFEFKSYKDKIRQTQIFTTEKYLYPAAMRSTAIIVSPKGADENALSAARGALRENGKLILNLSLEHVCRMLKSRDSGDSPVEILAEQLDRMLTRIVR